MTKQIHVNVPASQGCPQHTASALGGPPSFKVASGKNSGQVVLKGKPVPKAVRRNF